MPKYDITAVFHVSSVPDPTIMEALRSVVNDARVIDDQSAVMLSTHINKESLIEAVNQVAEDFSKLCTGIETDLRAAITKKVHECRITESTP